MGTARKRRCAIKHILSALKGARLIGEMVVGGELIRHYLLPDGRVLEIVFRRS